VRRVEKWVVKREQIRENFRKEEKIFGNMLEISNIICLD
jgi:hypothetical protein